MADIRSLIETLGSGDPTGPMPLQRPPLLPVTGPDVIGQHPAPAILKRPLFDYSKLREVPDVPQRDLPRYVPPRGASEEALEVAKPANIKRLKKLAKEGSQIGGLEWYNLEPLRQAFMEHLGKDKGNQQFLRYLELISATSPQTRVPENIRNASYYLKALGQGEPIPQRILDVRPKGTYPIIKPGTEAPQPYRPTLPLHIQNIENILKHGGIPELKNPKPASFVQNLAGNQRPVTIDTHNMRILGEPISTQMSRIFGERAVPNPNEYGFLERLQQREAEKLGMTPAQYQASLWLGGAKQTGVKSGYEPALKHIENRIEYTAQKRGESKDKVLKDFITGRAALLEIPNLPAAAFAYLRSKGLL